MLPQAWQGTQRRGGRGQDGQGAARTLWRAQTRIVRNLRDKDKPRPVGRKSILTPQVGSLRREKTRKWFSVNV